MANDKRKQLLEDLKQALRKERPEHRESFLRGWKQADSKLKRSKTRD